MAREVVGEIRDRLDIVDIVGERVQLKKAGRNYKGLCPFHQEKTPSFVVFPDSGNFHCFGCGKGGDVFTFYMESEKVEFREALQELARKAGIELRDTPALPPEADAHRSRLIELNELAATFYANILQNSSLGETARTYIATRGIDKPTQERFRLGAAPDRWDALAGFLGSRGVDPALATEAGLLQPREGGGHYDRFRNRLLFPIRNRDGQVVGFGGRAFGDAQPKYLNSPQSAIFDKGALVWGLDLARDAIRDADEVVIVEGYMDALTAHQFGYRNVVAAMGTALTEPQVDQLQRLTKRIVLALDADAAGQAATLRSLETMSSSLGHDEQIVPDPQSAFRIERRLKTQLRIVQLPEGKDPDDLIRRDPARWPEIVATAQPYLDFVIGAVTDSLDTADAEGKRVAVTRLIPLLQLVPDPLVRDHYVNLVSTKTGVDYRRLQSQMRQASIRGTTGTSRTMPDPAAQRAPVEEYLVALLLRHRSLVRDLIPQVPIDSLNDARARDLMAVLSDRSIGDDLEPLQLLAGLEDHLADYGERLLDLLADRPGQLPGAIRDDVTAAIRRLELERFDRLMDHLLAEIRQAETSGERDELADLTKQLAVVTEQRRQFYPRPSPYFRDTRDQGSSPTVRRFPGSN